MRPPPGSTLFPYTTLFRSGLGGDTVRCRCGAEPGDGARAARLRERHDGGRVAGDGVPGRVLEDRKSTRLNSSHSQNSYAVFCLKKKNTMMTLPSHSVSNGM